MKFDKYQFRCSSLGKIMVEPRKKSELLSETTKEYLREIYIKEVFGRERDVYTKFMDKGNNAEEDSLNLVTQNLGKLLVKNKKELSNEWIKGTPDIVLKDKVIDIKTSWDMWTFMNANGKNRDYYWQLQGYMLLTGKEKAELVYTLVNTPTHLIVSEKGRQAYQRGLVDGTEEYDQMETRVEKNMTFDDVDPNLRMKVFEIEKLGDLELSVLFARIEASRDYLNNLTL